MSKSDWIKKIEANRKIVTKLLKSDRDAKASVDAKTAYKRQIANPNSSYWQVVCDGFAKAANAGHTLVAFRYDGPSPPHLAWSNLNNQGISPA